MTAWKILVACIMLNMTTRKQVQKVIREFFEKWSTPEKFLESTKDEVIETVKSLGLCSRRESALRKMTQGFILDEWNDIRELSGIGEYAARSYEIFILGKLGDIQPKDHALTAYWKWVQNEKEKEKTKEAEKSCSSWNDPWAQGWSDE